MNLVRTSITTVAACTLIATPFAAVSTPHATLVSAPVIDLPGDRRVIQSVEPWYARANWRENRPLVRL